MGNDRQDNPVLWLQDSRSRILNILLGVAVGFGVPAILVIAWTSFQTGDFNFRIYYYAIGFLAALILFIFRRIPYRVRALLFLFALVSFGIFAFYTGWLEGGARIFLLGAVVCAAVLIGPRAGLLVAGLCLAAYAGFALAISEGWLILPQMPDPTSAHVIAFEGFGFAITTGVTVISLWFLRQALDAVVTTFQDAQKSREQLAESAQQLDQANQELNERTRVLETFNQALENQIWRTTGQIQLDDVLRSQLGRAQLAERVIGQLCKYLDAQVGALFLLEDGVLRLWGRFAYPSNSSLPETYMPGRGLVGQAAIEKQMILVDDLVDDNFKVTSALGEALPRGLAAIPFLFQEQVIGVVEMGTLHGFSPRDIFFLNSVMPSIAVTFQTALANERINELLEETRKQADVLQAQEEELRAANEELLAQTDALHDVRKKSRRGKGG
jgi:hypothetical protein